MSLHIVMADIGITFDGRTKEQKPLGGAETAFAELAEALAAHGHKVEAWSRCAEPLEWKGVRWTPLDELRGDLGIPKEADLYIANRSHQLINQCPKAKRAVFWVHNPAGYLKKLRYQLRLFWRKPVIVFTGESHLATYVKHGFGGRRVIIPLGITPLFLNAAPREAAPPPRAVFLSNPTRSLDWLMDVWVEKIRPAVTGAELHVFAGTEIYGAMGDKKAAIMKPILDRAAELKGSGIILRGALPKQQLAEEIAQARLFLYRGDSNETFCLAAAETQAMGLPGVVEDIGCMRERIIDGSTGFVTRGRDEFAEKAIRLLIDDRLWRTQHLAALRLQREWTWPKVAEAFERLAAF